MSVDSYAKSLILKNCVGAAPRNLGSSLQKRLSYFALFTALVTGYLLCGIHCGASFQHQCGKIGRLIAPFGLFLAIPICLSYHTKPYN